MPRVVMQQAWLPEYRVPFFQAARGALRSLGIDFQLVHGRPHGDDAAKGSEAHLPWATVVPQHDLGVGGRTLTWQSSPSRTHGADLVIAEQSTSQLAVHAIQLRAVLRSTQRFAFWGHGRNFQTGSASPIGEAIKRGMSMRADWWFAYNERSVEIVRQLGFPADRITNFRNAVDTAGLRRTRESVSPDELSGMRAQLGIDSENIAVFVGGLYREKRLDFLMSACDAIRERLTDFHIIIVGDGPEMSRVQSYATSRPWVHAVGPIFGDSKVPYMLLAKLQLMPGLVGLTVLDSFALEVPLITVADSEHSPEVAYLRHGENGLMLPAGTDPRGFAEATVSVLRDPGLHRRLVVGCGASSRRYTIESMAGRFVEGVQRALALPVRPPLQRLMGRW